MKVKETNKILIFFILTLAFVRVGFSQTQFTVNADGSYNTCFGIFYDSGGSSGAGYSAGEDYTVTICPDNPNDVITLSFTTFNLDLFDDNPLPGGNNYNVDQMYIYDGNSTSANFLGNYTGDALQNAVVKATPQNPTGCLTIRFVSNSSNNPVGTQNWQFAFSATCTTPCSDPFAGGQLLGGFTQDSIHVCIGENIIFQEIGSFAQAGFNLASYEWDFMDGTTASGQNVMHAFSAPGYYRVQLFVTDDNGCTNNNLIDLDIKVATEPNFSSFVKDTTICVGESLSLTANPLLFEQTWTSINGLLEIQDGCMYDTLLGVAQDLDLIQTGFISGSTITNISEIESICLEIEHTFIGDLVIQIICPNGQSAILHQQGGGGTELGEPVTSDNIDCNDPTTYGLPYQYCFTPTAVETWVDYVNNNSPQTLPAGDYAPVEPLNQLVGCPTNGIWTLSVVDNWAADDGKVFSFGLNLAPHLYGDIVEFTPKHSTVSDSSFWSFPSTFGTFLSADADSMVIVPTAPGIYVYPYTVVNDFGCSNDTSVTITVFEVQLPFTLVDAQVCAGQTFPVQGDFQPCTFTLKLIDSFGDSWNGNNLSVSINGGATNTYTVSNSNNGGLFIDIPISLTQGDELIFTFDGAGSFQSECSYQLIDCNGNVILEEGTINTLQTTPLTYVVNVQAGAPGYTFVWSPPGVLDNPTIANPNATISGNTTITMSYFPNDHPACIVSDQMLASIVPDANAGNDNAIDSCISDVFTYDFTGLLGPNFTPNGVWTDPSGTVVTMPISLVNFVAGPYTYSVSNGTCSDFATIMADIRAEASMHTNFVSDPHVCLGETSLFMNTAAFQNLDSIIVAFGDTSALLNVTANYNLLSYVYPYIGTFDVTVDIFSSNGCDYHDLYNNIVSVHDYPEADFNYKPEEINVLNPIVNVNDESTPNMSSYFWEFPGALMETSTNSSETVTYPFQSGLFPITLYIEDSIGCRDSITKTIKIDEIPLIFFPNSFTPNDDELNQTWKINAQGVLLDQFKLKIFNRWGEVIFETNDSTIGWDGTFNNQTVPNGIYMWKLEAVDAITNTTIEKQGHITLIR